MEIKTHPPVTVLYSAHETTLKHLHSFVGIVVKDLLAEANKQQATAPGAPLWIYKGADGKPDTLFNLEIAIPIKAVEAVSSDRFAAQALPAFKALTYTHKGPWENLGQAYSTIMQYANKEDLSLKGESREVYLTVDFNNPENNITEIQVGVQ